MKKFILVLSAFFLAASAACAAETPATPAVTDPAKDAMMAQAMQLSSPGEAHKILEPLAGNWNYKIAWKMSPDAPPEESTGTAEFTIVLGGRFLRQDVKGVAMGKPFEGMGYTGYDNVRGEYTSAWFDNMSTGIMASSGQYDAAAQTIREAGNFSCPMTGNKAESFRGDWKIIDSDHMVYEFYKKSPDGAEFKSMQLDYTRTQP